MPSSEGYKRFSKSCTTCGEGLILNNNRDIQRKNFCSRTCANTFSALNRPEKSFQCSLCSKDFLSKGTTAKYCSDPCKITAQLARSYKYLNDNPEGYIKHLIAKPERKHLKAEQLIDMYTKQEGLCSISGVPMTFIKVVGGDKVHTNLSIDRIDPSKGYELDNIQLVCAIVNIMKSILTTEELIWWADEIVSTKKAVSHS